MMVTTRRSLSEFCCQSELFCQNAGVSLTLELMLSVTELIGTHDVVLITLDTLRWDVADRAVQQGRIPMLQRLLPGGNWECRHSPGSFTYAAHQAFFAGFLPTPRIPGPHPRLFACQFPGSETISPQTCVFDAPDIVRGFQGRGYHTLCIGGVGFFNKLTPLGMVLPGLFAESHWSTELGVTEPNSTAHQVDQAQRSLSAVPAQKRIFLFVNISAIHQPNYFYLPGAAEDGPETQLAALEYVDRSLRPLWKSLTQRGPSLCIVCSDHGTAYGEEGYWGHRLAHPVVWNVPYAEFLLSTNSLG